MTYKLITVPTGHIAIIEGEKGKLLEFLSIGDYGKSKNIKADFLGYTKPINGVAHCELLPLEKKWVITISTQYGCSMGCTFCDVPKVGPGINATYQDILDQVYSGISLHPEIKHTNRLNLHFARMGEPTFNPDVLSATIHLIDSIKYRKKWGFHPVISTMMPNNNKHLKSFLEKWMYIKYILDGDAGLQLSINTTDETIRERDFNNNAHTLSEIANIVKDLPVAGRKITLNFALTEAPIDANLLAKLFNPNKFMCKITPMHKTNACIKNNLWGSEQYQFYYPYEIVECNLKNAGFDVIVFVPSIEEDLSRITCGNAILAEGK